MTAIAILLLITNLYALFFLLSAVGLVFQNWPNDLKLYICLALSLPSVWWSEKNRTSKKGTEVVKLNANENTSNLSISPKMSIVTIAVGFSKTIRTMSASRQEGEVSIMARVGK